MTPGERELLIDRWRRPSSSDEISRQERALRMVSEAIDASPLKSVRKRVYAKGSYANNTNVRLDSDVDIAVDCHELMYYDSASEVAPKVSLSPYSGTWNPSTWRQALTDALTAKFGSDVDTSGAVAIFIPEVEGSRPNTDVVPGFHYRLYKTSDRQSYEDGSKVFPTNGLPIINWPDQQLANGRAKNDKTGKRYKDFVRVLKNAENRLVELYKIEEKPSFLMECLVFNVLDDTLMRGSLGDAFGATLQELRIGLSDENRWKQWVEPNWLKWAFRGSKKWTVDDAREVVNGAWDLLEYR
jgi:hypothetical protein